VSARESAEELVRHGWLNRLEVRRELEHENQRLRERVAQQSHDSMQAALDAQVPGWRQIYSNPRFAQWLGSPDLYSGRLRSQLINEAVDAGNTARP
jgi:hypothetical protein